MATTIEGRATDGGVLWWGDGPMGRLAHGLGDESTLDELLASARGMLAGVRRVNLPRRVELPAGFTRYDDWDFRWSETPPPPQRGESVVRRIDDAAAIEELLDVAFPDSMLRPRTPPVDRRTTRRTSRR